MKLSSLVGSLATLSLEQKTRCKDAGFTSKQRLGKNNAWYDLNKSSINWNDPTQPAFENQIAALESAGIELDIDLNYSIARHAIRELALMDGTDTEYIRAINDYKKQADHRNATKRQKRREQKIASTSSPPQLAHLDVRDEDPVETKAFWQSLVDTATAPSRFALDPNFARECPTFSHLLQRVRETLMYSTSSPEPIPPKDIIRTIWMYSNAKEVVTQLVGKPNTRSDREVSYEEACFETEHVIWRRLDRLYSNEPLKHRIRYVKQDR